MPDCRLFLVMCLSAASAMPMQAQSGGETVISGQLVCEVPMAFDRFRVEVSASGLMRDTPRPAFAATGGQFRLHGVIEGTVELRVVNETGAVVARRIVQTPAASGLEIELPAPPGAGKGGAVSLYRLQHAVPKDARKRWQKAAAEAREGRQEKAEALLMEAVRADPEFADALEQLGIYALVRRDYEQARGYLTRAARLDTANVAFQSHAALAAYLTGHDHEAEAFARYTLRLGPDDNRAHYVLGLVMLRQRKDETEALRHLEMAGKEFPRAAGIAAKLRGGGQHLKSVEGTHATP